MGCPESALGACVHGYQGARVRVTVTGGLFTKAPDLELGNQITLAVRESRFVGSGCPHFILDAGCNMGISHAEQLAASAGGRYP